MIIKIEKMDHLGNGIGYFNGKVVFVPFTIVNDEIEFSVVQEKKNYINGKLEKIINPSIDRKEPFCPYYYSCGGCHLQNYDYESTLKYKKEKIENILNKNNMNYKINIIRNPSPKNYRNKIDLKIVNKKIGFFEPKSHKIIAVDHCGITKDAINKFIKEIKNFNINEGNIVIRCNYNDELLLSIYTKDDIRINESILPNYKVAGIVLNDECIYGENHFLDKINDLFFEVSYNSFFQVNSGINSILFNIIKDNVSLKDSVLDLYSGVGTLSLAASRYAKDVIGIEIVKNAVINALKNKKINNINNAEFLVQDLEREINLEKRFDTIIVDPPRSGIDTKTMTYILNSNAKKIIYVSCDPNTLARDLNLLIDKYEIKEITALDMFSFTYHVETVCVMKLR